MLFTRHLRQEENIDKRANLIELSSINNTTYISIHPPFSEKMSRKSQDAACIYTMDSSLSIILDNWITSD